MYLEDFVHSRLEIDRQAIVEQNRDILSSSSTRLEARDRKIEAGVCKELRVRSPYDRDPPINHTMEDISELGYT